MDIELVLQDDCKRGEIKTSTCVPSDQVYNVEMFYILCKEILNITSYSAILYGDPVAERQAKKAATGW